MNIINYIIEFKIKNSITKKLYLSFKIQFLIFITVKDYNKNLKTAILVVKMSIYFIPKEGFFFFFLNDEM